MDSKGCASQVHNILTAVMTNIVVDKNTVHAKRNVDLSNHRVSGAALFLVWSRFILINLIISLWRESKILQFASFFLNWINMQFLIVKQLNRNCWPLTPIDEPGNHKKLKKKLANVSYGFKSTYLERKMACVRKNLEGLNCQQQIFFTYNAWKYVVLH